MGQQQLLLIIIGVIIVGIAIIVGISIYKANEKQSQIDHQVTTLLSWYSLAISYYQKPKSMGGGERSFEGFLPPGVTLTQSVINPPEFSLFGTIDDGKVNVYINYSNGFGTPLQIRIEDTRYRYRTGAFPGVIHRLLVTLNSQTSSSWNPYPNTRTYTIYATREE
jgi:hypothetical protein